MTRRELAVELASNIRIAIISSRHEFFPGLFEGNGEVASTLLTIFEGVFISSLTLDGKIDLVYIYYFLATIMIY